MIYNKKPFLIVRHIRVLIYGQLEKNRSGASEYKEIYDYKAK